MAGTLPSSAAPCQHERQKQNGRAIWAEGSGRLRVGSITRIELETEAQIPGIDEATFQRNALDAKQNCPVSKALAGTEIHLTAVLL